MWRRDASEYMHHVYTSHGDIFKVWKSHVPHYSTHVAHEGRMWKEENIRNIPVWVAVSPDIPIHHLVAVKVGEWITNSLVARS